MRRIIGIGETVLDVIFRCDQPQAAVAGGSTFNAMVSLGRTAGVRWPEMPIMMITETGDDHIGNIIIDFMRQNNISTEGVTRRKNSQSHISMAFLNENNDAQYEFYKDHAAAQLDESIVRRIRFGEEDIVVFGSFFAINPVLRNYTRALLTQAHESGAILYYDINFRKTHIKDIPATLENIKENCRLSDIVRGSAEDFGYLFGTTDPAEIYEKHIKMLCPNFICTNGGSSIEVFCGKNHYTYKVPRVKTVSTIGAGDNFNAGITYGLVSLKVFKESADKTLGLDAATWKLLTTTAKKFSANVCRSIYNYVDKDFVKKLR